MNALVLQGRKIVTSGETGSGSPDLGGGYGQRAIARDGGAGKLDATFGTGGQVTTVIGDPGAGRRSAHALRLVNGKAVGAGIAYANFTPSSWIGDLGLARYLL